MNIIYFEWTFLILKIIMNTIVPLKQSTEWSVTISP